MDGNGIAANREGTATDGVIEMRLLSDVTLNCVNGVRRPARRLSLTPYPKSQFHIFRLLSLTFPFCFCYSTPSNNHKKRYQNVFRSVCPFLLSSVLGSPFKHSSQCCFPRPIAPSIDFFTLWSG